MKKVTVYCASSAQIAPKYFEATETLARLLVAQNIHVVFGGGSRGLMGKLADVVLAEGGHIQGVMPKFMDDVEWGHPDVKDFIYTKTMNERKELLIKDTNAIITLPGGSGSLEELLEVITLKRLGLFTQPIIILNTDGYYEPLKMMLERCVEEKFMHPKHLDMWTFVDEPHQVIPAIKEAAEWDGGAINFASI